MQVNLVQPLFPWRLLTVKLTLEYDTSLDIWEVSHRDVHLHDEAAIDEWRKQLHQQLEKLGGKKSYLLIDMKGVELSPAFAERYGKVVREVLADHALGTLRYGKPDGWTAMAVELQGAMNNYSAVVFADRTAAVLALSMLRAHTN